MSTISPEQIEAAARRIADRRGWFWIDLTQDQQTALIRDAEAAIDASSETSSDWTISAEGTSQTTVLAKNGTPIARFYAGRLDDNLVAHMLRKLNA